MQGAVSTEQMSSLDAQLLGQALGATLGAAAASQGASRGSDDAPASRGDGLDAGAVLEVLLPLLAGTADAAHGQMPDMAACSDSTTLLDVAHQHDQPPASISGINAELSATAERVVLLRAQVPQAVAAAVAQQIEAWRPTLRAAELALTATNLTPGKIPRSPMVDRMGQLPKEAPVGPVAAIASASAPLGQLHTDLVQALDKVPNLRARMDEVSKRMTNILRAVEEQQAQEDLSQQYTNPLRVPPTDWVVGVLARDVQ